MRKKRYFNLTVIIFIAAALAVSYYFAAKSAAENLCTAFLELKSYRMLPEAYTPNGEDSEISDHELARLKVNYARQCDKIFTESRAAYEKKSGYKTLDWGAEKEFIALSYQYRITKIHDFRFWLWNVAEICVEGELSEESYDYRYETVLPYENNFCYTFELYMDTDGNWKINSYRGGT